MDEMCIPAANRRHAFGTPVGAMRRHGAAAFACACLVALLSPPARACPVCDSGTGKAVRQGLFNAEFGKNLLMTALPFPIFLGIAAYLYYGPPTRRGRSDARRGQDTSGPDGVYR